MATIYIDGKAYEADAKDNLLKACTKLGIDVPYFCYHPALGSVGSCRLCAVKRFRDAEDKKGRIVMSCMEPVTEGMYVSVADEEVKNFRASIIESLMTNHPHDCPVCDEGGECHLQDMTLMSGHNYRRFEFKKRTFKNQDLGPYINHEMNRCIQCYRCVRYYADYAGGKDFGVFGAHNALYFGRVEDGKLESEFSGNLIEVCPTGVFTDKTLKKHYVRKWDLTYAPSVCTKCSVGCNTIVGERYGLVRRVLNRYNKEVNGYFLCDRGRFGYEFINDEKRIRKPLYNKTEITVEEAITKTAFIVSANTIAIGSSTASIESNYALRKLVGKENFYAGVTAAELQLTKQILNIYKNEGLHVASLLEIEKSEGVLILGEDILASAPRLALSVRQMVKNKPMVIAQRLNIPDWNDNAVKTALGAEKGPLFIVAPSTTGLDDVATAFNANEESTNRLATAILAIQTKTDVPDGVSKEEKALAEEIIRQFSTCNSVSIISGTRAGSKTIELAAALTKAFASNERKTAIHIVVPEGNSIGQGILADKSLDEALQLIENGKVDNLLILENNLYDKLSKEKLDGALSKLKNLIVLDHTSTELSEKANLVISVGTFAESDGTVINAEGRMQRYFNVLPAMYGMRQGWKWLLEIDAQKVGKTNEIHFDKLVKEISEQVAEFSKITEVAPSADYRLMHMKVPRQTPRFSGRTSMMAHINVSEQQPPKDEESPLAFTMEGAKAIPPQELTAYYWTPGWNSNAASNRYLNDLNNVLKGREPGIRIFK